MTSNGNRSVISPVVPAGSVVTGPNGGGDSTFDIYAALEEKAKYLRIINELALGLLQRSTVDEILWMVAKTAVANLGFEDCVIYLIDETGSRLVQRAAHGPKNPVAHDILNPIVIEVGDGIVGTVAKSGEPEIIFDTTSDPRYIVDDNMRQSELAVPIIHGNRVIGVIDSEHPEKAFYSQEHLEILVTIASIASHNIATALLIEKLQFTEEALRKEELRYRTLYHYHPSMIFTLDMNGVVQSVNDFTQHFLGYSAGDIVGRNKTLFHMRTDRDALRANIEKSFRHPGALFRWESHLERKDGTAVRVRESARTIDMPNDEGRVLLVVTEDITEAYELAQTLEFQAAHDPLTGVLNRREFERRLDTVIDDPERARNSVLGFIDVDQFKIINDACGHVAGDELLRQFACQLTDQIRDKAIIGRLGGDEFGLLFERTELDTAVRICDEIRQALEYRRFDWDHKSLSLAVSIGVVTLSSEITSVSEALSAADVACYDAKRHGRNRVHIYNNEDGGRVRRNEEAAVVQLLQNALDADELLLYFQPIHSTSGSRICRFGEILGRLKSSDGEIIPASQFIPLADRYDLIERLDRVIIGKTLNYLSQQHHRDVQNILFSINVSGRSIGDLDFLEYTELLLKRLRRNDLRVCFEITETAAVSNIGNAQRFIKRLQEYGCRFALDDFGSAFSSFMYLKHLPVDYLKIEGTFVRDICEDDVNISIVRSINEIGHSLGKRIIAESVENEQVLGILRGIGVDFVQGIHLGTSQPLEQFLHSPPPDVNLEPVIHSPKPADLMGNRLSIDHIR